MLLSIAAASSLAACGDERRWPAASARRRRARQRLPAAQPPRPRRRPGPTSCSRARTSARSASASPPREEPWSSAWTVFLQRYADPDLAGPRTWIRAPSPAASMSTPAFLKLDEDSRAARNLAIAYAVSGDIRYAQTAHDVLVAWSARPDPTTLERLRQPRHGPAAELGRVLVRLRLRPHAGPAGSTRETRRPRSTTTSAASTAALRGAVERLAADPSIGTARAAALRVDRRAHVPVRGPRHRRHLRHGPGSRAARPRLPDGRRSHRGLGPGGRAQPPARRPGGGPRAATRQRRRRPGHSAGADVTIMRMYRPDARRDRRLHDVHGPPRHAALPGRGQPRRGRSTRQFAPALADSWLYLARFFDPRRRRRRTPPT